jgi:GntR family transcriptional regulator
LILRKEYQEGKLLPDEMTLSKQLGVSRQTVRSGIGHLVFEGILERRAGIGTRVVKVTSESAIMAWRSLSREMAKKGITVQTFNNDARFFEASEDAARALRIEPGRKILRLDRLRGWEDVPALRSRSWFHPRLNLDGSEDFSRPLYEVIEKASGFLADRAEEELLAVSAEKELVSLLSVGVNSPLLLRRHIVFDRGNNPIEFAEVHYVSKRFVLTLDLQRGE